VGWEPEADFLCALAVRKAGWAPRFAEDIVRVEALTGWDLAGWRS
jgi:hypothetical protein